MGNETREFLLSAKFMEKLKDPQKLKKKLLEGEKVQDVMELSDENVLKFCEIAQELFKKGQYKEAADAFLFLVTLDSHRYEYWIGLGEAKEHCHEYESAIDAYEIAALVDVGNPVPYFHLAKCFFSVHNREASRQSIDLAIEYSEDRSGLEELHRQALAVRLFLLKEE